MGIGEKIFIVRVERLWHRLLREIVGGTSLEVFKARQGWDLSNLG